MADDFFHRHAAAGCVFCDKIAAGDVEDTVHVNTDVVRFTPLNPVTEGHMLFVPTYHAESAAEYPWLAGQVMIAAASYAFLMAEDHNLITSTGTAATQTVRHYHLHYVPRRPGDGLKLPWTDQDTSPKETSA